LHVYFSNPWHAFASHGLPAIAELLVFIKLRGGAGRYRQTGGGEGGYRKAAGVTPKFGWVADMEMGQWVIDP